MKLEELDIEDGELIDSVSQDDNFDEETYEKPWMGGSNSEDPLVEPEAPKEESDVDEGLVNTILRDKGINPDSIKFKTETGEIEERSFSELTREEQLQILNFDDSQDNYGLADEEIDLINELRDNNLSIEAYKEYIGKQAIQEFLANNDSEVPTYNVDSISDDELYVIDLKAKIPELTDEDASAELDLAKQNETLYQKKVQGIRNEYKKREDLLATQEQEEQEEQAKLAAEEFETTIVGAIQDNDTIDLGESSLTLSEDDMNEIASFILDSDVTGVRHIAKALNDPKTLVGMVWYALKGQEAFGQISDYYRQKITEVSKFNYNKGYEDAKSGIKPNAAKTIVKRQPAQQTKRALTIDDLD